MHPQVAAVACTQKHTKKNPRDLDLSPNTLKFYINTDESKILYIPLATAYIKSSM